MISHWTLWAAKLNDLFCPGSKFLFLIKMLKSTRPFIPFFNCNFFFCFSSFSLNYLIYGKLFWSFSSFFWFFTYFININFIFFFFSFGALFFSFYGGFFCFIYVLIYKFNFVFLLLFFWLCFWKNNLQFFFVCLISSSWLISSILSLIFLFLIFIFLFSSSSLPFITVFFFGLPFQYNMY